MKRNYIITFVCEFVVMASVLCAYKLTAYFCPTEEFALYSLTRRFVSLLQIPLMIGMGISIPRYMSMAAENSGSSKESSYYVTGTVISLGLVVLCAFVFFITKNEISFLLYGDRGHEEVVVPLMLVVAGSIWHTLNYGYFRGRMDMAIANGLQITMMGVLPLIGILAGDGTTRRIFMITGALMLMGTLCTSLYILAGSAHRSFDRAKARQLLRYGSVRVPGECALVGLLALPPMIMAHAQGTTEAGYFAFGISIVSMIGSVFAPVGLVMLPAIGKDIARGVLTGWQRGFLRLVKVSVVFVMVVSILLYVISSWVFDRFLGSANRGVVPYVQMCLFAALPYVFYVISRNVLDALHERPYNTKNLLAGLVLFIVLSLAIGGRWIPWCFVVSMYVVGGMMVKDIMGSIVKTRRHAIDTVAHQPSEECS